MKVLITIPAFGANGGLGVIIQWANHLANYHEVYLWNLRGNTNTTWHKISVKVKQGKPNLEQMQVVILTSPHAAFMLDHIRPHQKCVLFLQMAEHLFNLKDRQWQQACKKFYQAPHLLLTISGWNRHMLIHHFDRDPDQTLYIKNGIDLSLFPISTKAKQGNLVLVENWESTNPTKDPLHLGPQVAAQLKKEGYSIICYGARPLTIFKDVPAEYHVQPTLKKLNELYERATILIKATRYDARACAPVEAMTKGTVTARAIRQGDDDLIHGQNCLKVAYQPAPLYEAAKRLLTNPRLRQRLADHCLQYAVGLSWEKVMAQVNQLISGK